MSKEYFEKGLYLFSEAGRQDRMFPGHTGAGVLSAAILLAENKISKELQEAIKKYIDNILSKEDLSGFSSGEIRQKDPILLAARGGIEKNSEKLRNSGHGIIFASLVIRSLEYLDDIPFCVDPKLVKNQIINCANGTEERYFGNPKHDDQERAFRTIQELSDSCVASLESIAPDQTIDGRRYFLTGEKIHSFTFTAALEDLKIAEIKGDFSWLAEKHIRLSEHEPVEGDLVLMDSSCDPFLPAYWENKINDIHSIKLLYALQRLENYFSDADSVRELSSKIFRQFVSASGPTMV